MLVNPTVNHIICDEMAGNRQVDFEWDGKGDVVEDSETWGHVRDLAFGERARIGWFFDLFFEAAGVVCQKWLSECGEGRNIHGCFYERLHIDLQTCQPMTWGCERVLRTVKQY